MAASGHGRQILVGLLTPSLGVLAHSARLEHLPDCSVVSAGLLMTDAIVRPDLQLCHRQTVWCMSVFLMYLDQYGVVFRVDARNLLHVDGVAMALFFVRVDGVASPRFRSYS